MTPDGIWLSKKKTLDSPCTGLQHGNVQMFKSIPCVVTSGSGTTGTKI